MWLHLLLFLAFLWFPWEVTAKYDPLTVPNNIFGIHIADTNDINDTAALINSSGGDWGYVTLVIQEDDRDQNKWQSILNRMRSLHLIPIVRLATHIDGDTWVKPYEHSGRDWAIFLNSLNWPIENRYIILFNEPNHANEWGRSIDPEGYARALVSHARELKAVSEDFYILPAGLDVSASSDGRSLDAYQFLSRMLKAEPLFFDVLDGWTSHSYANPGFSGHPAATGRGTLRSYLWELHALRQLGVTKKLPVFITETGWVHSNGVKQNVNLTSPEVVSDYIQIAASSVWQDQIITAVTPFVFSYQGLPFDHFSWKKLGANAFYPQYFSYQEIEKVQGKPKQRERYTLDHRLIPSSLVAGSTYEVSALVKNDGQGIYTEDKNIYTIDLVTNPKFVTIKNPLPLIEPGQFGTLIMHIETPNVPGEYPYTVDVVHGGNRNTVESGTLKLVQPPSIDLDIQLGWRTENSAVNATVLIYDNNTLIHKVQGVVFKKGKTTVKELRNIVPIMKYRVVVLVPFYLPRQQIVSLRPDTTSIQMPTMIPLDFNLDGNFTWKDLLAVIKLSPHFIRSLFI